MNISKMKTIKIKGKTNNDLIGEIILGHKDNIKNLYEELLNNPCYLDKMGYKELLPAYNYENEANMPMFSQHKDYYGIYIDNDEYNYSIIKDSDIVRYLTVFDNIELSNFTTPVFFVVKRLRSRYREDARKYTDEIINKYSTLYEACEIAKEIYRECAGEKKFNIYVCVTDCLRNETFEEAINRQGFKHKKHIKPIDIMDADTEDFIDNIEDLEV